MCHYKINGQNSLNGYYGHMVRDVLSKLRYTTVAASEAKNQFGQVLESALHDGAVVITKHDAPKAILLSMDEFNALAGPGQSTLDSLSADFDAMLARMQTPRARSGMQAAFGASPKALGKGAVAAARKRG